MIKTVKKARRYLCHLAAGLMALLIVLPISSMLMDRTVPYSAVEGEIVPYSIPQGGTGSIHWRGIRKRDCDGIVKRTIIDIEGNVHPLPEARTAYYQDPKYKFSREFRVPEYAVSGPAIYQAQTLFICNPIHYLWPIPSISPAVKFNIVAK